MKSRRQRNNLPYSKYDLGYGPQMIIPEWVPIDPFMRLIGYASSPLSKILHWLVYGELLRGSSRRIPEVLVKLKDGAKIATDVYLPKDVYNKRSTAPTILIRTPYWKDTMGIVGHYFAVKGYVCVIQDIRGCGHSSPYGNNAFFFSERNDGLETARWIKNQFWYNGKLGMWGASYLGLCEWAVSWDNDDLFDCLTPGLASPKMIWSAHNGLDILGIGVDIGRIFHETTKFYTPKTNYLKEWTHQATENQRLNPKYALYNDPMDQSHHFLNIDRDLKGLSFEEKKRKFKQVVDIDFTKRDFGKFQGLLDEIIIKRRVNFFSYYMAGMLEFDPSKINTPMLILSGWYDMFSRPIMESFTEIQENIPDEMKNKIRMTVGPWAHGEVQMSAGTIWDAFFKVGGWMDFLKTFSPWKWYDYWLKGDKNDILDKPPVKIYVMNKDEWRYEREWPLSRAVKRELYINSNGKNVDKVNGGGFLSWEKPSSGAELDQYLFDPMNPVISRGGNNLELPKGEMEQEDCEVRDDVLVYTSPPLRRGMEVTGNVEFILYAATEGKDTDFMVKLCDVKPSGKSVNILDRGIRARYREFDYDKPTALEPLKIYEYTIPLGPTSNYFRAGNRIRIDITSSDWPKYNINSNMAGEGDRFDYKKVIQKIYHTSKYPSRLILPVIFDYF